VKCCSGTYLEAQLCQMNESVQASYFSDLIATQPQRLQCHHALQVCNFLQLNVTTSPRLQITYSNFVCTQFQKRQLAEDSNVLWDAANTTIHNMAKSVVCRLLLAYLLFTRYNSFNCGSSCKFSIVRI
jgi:hypothetical protein